MAGASRRTALREWWKSCRGRLAAAAWVLMYAYGLSDKDLDMRERPAEAKVIECGEGQWHGHERSHGEPGAEGTGRVRVYLVLEARAG